MGLAAEHRHQVRHGSARGLGRAAGIQLFHPLAQLAMPLCEALHHLHGHFGVLTDHPHEGAAVDGDEIGIFEGQGRLLARQRLQQAALAEEVPLGQFLRPLALGLL